MIEQRSVEVMVAFQPIAVDTASSDQEGMLAIADGLLIGVLVRLGTEHKEHDCWFMEAGFGRLSGYRPPPFASLDYAARWLISHLNT